MVLPGPWLQAQVLAAASSTECVPCHLGKLQRSVSLGWGRGHPSLMLHEGPMESGYSMGSLEHQLPVRGPEQPSSSGLWGRQLR